MASCKIDSLCTLMMVVKSYSKFTQDQCEGVMTVIRIFAVLGQFHAEVITYCLYPFFTKNVPLELQRRYQTNVIKEH